jgi:hypothetical protein
MTIINEILDITRIEAGKMPCSFASSTSTNWSPR